jgi:hypothetical protein
LKEQKRKSTAEAVDPQGAELSASAGRSLPTFLIIGAQKAGTTSLWGYLRAHPQVFVPDMKETGFFVEEVRWNLGLGWYQSLFAGSGEAIARGEASTFYTMFPFANNVPKRIASVCPDVGLVYLVRHPIARMRSAFIQALWDGSERRPISEALLWDPRYVAFSRYALQLEQYLRYFSEDQILVLTAEELRHNRSETLQRVLNFIGVDPSATIDTSIELNRSDEKRALRPAGRLVRRVVRTGALPKPVARRLSKVRLNSLGSRAISPEETLIEDAVRRRLEDLVRPDIESLRRWLGPAFDGWGLID